MIRFKSEITDLETGEVSLQVISEDNIELNMELMMAAWLEHEIDYQLYILRVDQWKSIDEFAIRELLGIQD